jgi:hypothetical protein
MGMQHYSTVPSLNEIRDLELGATFLSESVCPLVKYSR